MTCIHCRGVEGITEAWREVEGFWSRPPAGGTNKGKWGGSYNFLLGATIFIFLKAVCNRQTGREKRDVPFFFFSLHKKTLASLTRQPPTLISPGSSLVVFQEKKMCV